MIPTRYIYVVANRRDDHMPHLIMMFIGPAFLIYMLVGFLPLLRNWQELQAPYSYVAGFYYYTIGLPAEGGLWLWDTIASLSLFEKSSSNTVFAILIMVIYSILMFFVYGVILALLQEAGIRPRKVLMLTFLPFILLIIWEVIV